MKIYYVYIMTNKNNNVLYTGVTHDLQRRVYEHKTSNKKGFTSKYKCNKLVFFDETTDVYQAIQTEKKIKSLSRLKKVELINKNNHIWEDLSKEWFD